MPTDIATKRPFYLLIPSRFVLQKLGSCTKVFII